MHLLDKKLRQELKKQIAHAPGCRILLGISGGADSVAMLRCLHAAQNELQTKLVVAHYNHQTRGKESLLDAQWVEQLSQELNIECIIGTAEQQATPISPAQSHCEESLREQRFQFLTETARQEKATIICLAHHADDQAETMLHHIIRGTGIEGLKGIPASRPLNCSPESSDPANANSPVDNLTLIHPMLQITRAEILDYLQSINQEFRTDASNQDLRYTRNRIRHQLLPMLQELNPQATRHLIQLNQQIQETLEYLQLEIEQFSKQCIISRDDDLIRLHASVLQTASPMIVRELFRYLWTRQQWPRKKMTYQHWESLAQFVQNDQKKLEFPARIIAQKRGEMMILERKSS